MFQKNYDRIEIDIKKAQMVQTDSFCKEVRWSQMIILFSERGNHRLKVPLKTR